MKLSTRLLLTLLPTVAVVMTVYGIWAVWHRYASLTSQTRAETQAYGAALGVAVEYAFRSGQLEAVQVIIDEISREPTVYGVLVYDTSGRPLYVSQPLLTVDAATAELLAGPKIGEITGVEREIEGQRVYSVLRPIRDSRGQVAGVVEVAQPLSFLEAETAHTGQRFLLNTLTLLAVLTLLTVWLVNRSVTRPLGQFVAAIRALGQGDLSQRLEKDPGGAELAALTGEFNRMASQLEAARAQVIHEADERVALERRIRETEKMAAVGNLAAGVAHEIAAPLNIIAGRAQMLLKQQVADDVLERNLSIIVDQIRRITTIVRNLLDFAKRREPSLQQVDLRAVLNEVAEFLESEFSHAGTRLECELPEPVWIRSDPDLLHQVFVNILINALQAVEQSDGAGSVQVTVQQSDGRVLVQVADSGPGIPEDIAPRIFEPFFTTKPAGTGLGLAVARNITEELGGSLTARNVASGGAVFEVLLPALETEPAHA